MSAPRRLGRCVRAVVRALLITAWTCVSVPIQSVLVALPGQAKVVFARVYWAVVCALLGMEVRVLGAAAGATEGGRPVIYVSNHSSWIDIAVLGGRLHGCFVSKADVARWPVAGTVARLGRTVFVSRSRSAAAAEKLDMARRLRGGDDLILFPEGTSSDGSRVLPFHSTFFAMAKPAERGVPASVEGLASQAPLVQPISLVYDRLAGMPVGRAGRPFFAWFGDMDLASHFWRLAQWRGMRATVLLHEPLDPADYATRKELAAAAWEAVASGAATLRQNRPAVPLRLAKRARAFSRAAVAA